MRPIPQEDATGTVGAPERPARRQATAWLGAGLLSARASAQPVSGYPSRPIELIQGFGVGGNADTVARLIGARLQSALGQSVVVEAKTGAGGNLASGYVAKARPDGYTLILLTGGHAVSAAYYRNLSFRPVDDFDMISTVCFFPFVIAVRPDHPAGSLQALLEQARRRPDSVTFSSVGIGSTQHLTGELLGVAAGAKLLHVPYRGGAAPIQGVIGGEVDLLVDTITVAGSQIEAGRLRALAVTSAAPWPALPGVPTVAATLPGFEVRSWLGVAAPAGLPAAVRQRLNTEMTRALAAPDVRQQLARLGADAQAGTPEQMRTMIEREIARWRAVIVKANLTQA